MSKNISDLSLQELKALAFDVAREFERVRNNLQIVTQEINKREDESVKGTDAANLAAANPETAVA